MNVKYWIFVSSTYEDLKAERAEVIKACLNMVGKRISHYGSRS